MDRQEEDATRMETRAVSALKDVVVAGELARAKRRALAIFDRWLRVTDCLEGSSYQWEVESIIEDAVEIGVQAAYGVHRPLQAEIDDDEESLPAGDRITPEQEPPRRIHGQDCPKAQHLGEGYLHDADDDRPYDIDGLTYCGRCHGWLER